MVIAWAAVGPGAAHAQIVRTDPHLEFSLAGDALYDDNVARSSRSLSGTRGLHREDVRFTPSVRVDGLIPFGAQQLTLLGSVGYDFYARNTRLNRERINLDSALALQFGRCDATVTAQYARRQSELDDIIVLGTGTPLPQRVRNVEDIKIIGASATCGGEVGLKPTGSVEQSWVDNSQSLRRSADYRRTRFSGGVAYARPSFGLLTLFGSHEETTFPNRPILVGGSGNDGFKLNGGGLRYERRIGSRLRGLAELSYTSVDPDRAGVKGFDGLTWRLSATADVNSRLLLSTEIGRSIEASNRVDANYFIERLYSLSASYALSPRLTLDASARQRKRDFRGAGLVLGPVLLNDRLRTFSAGLRFQPRKSWTFSLTGTHETRDANDVFYDYTSNRVGVGIAKRF